MNYCITMIFLKKSLHQKRKNSQLSKSIKAKKEGRGGGKEKEKRKT